ncbi:MAG: hypothetical protein AXW12_00515 [Thalassospira sp. Nap_22]|nr:MAG: hypothetical protein AXW12_00515 [Thalassospira sp. Nap_22]
MEVTVKDMRGCKRADIVISPFTVVGGRNGNGKTSLLEAVAAATSGQVNIKGLPKKDLGDIVANGTKEGSVLIRGNNGEDDYEIGIAFPKAERRTEGKVPQVSAYAAGIVSFFSVKPDERASLLIRYLKAAPTLADLTRDLTDINFPVEEGDADQNAANERAIKALFEDIEIKGWDSVHQELKQQWTKAKGAWEQITGEKYGSAKIHSWRPDNLPAGTEHRHLVAALEEAEAELAKLQKDQTLSSADRDRLQAEAADHDFRVKALDTAKEELAEAQKAVTAAEEARNALPSVDGQPDWKCPCCDKPLNISVVGGEVRGVTKFEGDQLSKAELAERRKAIAGADGTLQNARSKVNELNRRIASLEIQIKTSEDAKQKLMSDKDCSEDDTAKAAEALEDANDAVVQARAELSAFDANEKAKIKAAEIERLGTIGKTVAPDGCRQRKLAECLDAFNDTYLTPVCEDAGWRPIVLNADLDVTFNGRRFDLISESEQWRCRVAMQVAMARLDGSDLVIIDGADILDIPNRQGLFAATSKCGLRVLVAGTFNKPESVPHLPPEIGHSYWIENGETRPLLPQQAAQAAE